MKNKIAAIDIGTNSFHLIIAGLNGSGKIETIEKSREVLRLNFTSGNKIIPQAAMEQAVLILSNFKKIAIKHNAVIKAIATSAVREAQNKNKFIEYVYENTGIKINAVNGSVEARLIYLGIQNALTLNNINSMCIDIGGGSTEIIITEKGKIIFSESLKLGAVRLTEMFNLKNEISVNNVTACKMYIKKELQKVKLPGINTNIVAGSSGTIVSVALMLEGMKGNKTSKDKLNGYIFSYKDLQTVKQKILSSKTLAVREQITGLEKKRADIITAGIILLTEIFQFFNIKEITISTSALREGIVLDNLQ